MVAVDRNSTVFGFVLGAIEYVSKWIDGGIEDIVICLKS
jgi:hypothetical protein